MKKNLTKIPGRVIRIYKQEEIMDTEQKSQVVVLSQITLLGLIEGIIILPSPPDA